MSKLNFVNYNNMEFISKVEEYFKSREVDSYFNIDFELDIYVYPKEEFDQVVLLKSSSYKKNVPNWLEGLTTETEVNIVKPNMDNVDKYVKLVVHELIHLILYKLDNEKNRTGARDKILEEGLAFYIANQMNKGMFEKLLEEYKASGEKFKNIENFFGLDSVTFAKENGYTYGFFLVKQIKNKYGKNRIIEYLEDNDKFRKDIGVLNSQLEDLLKLEMEK